METAMNGFKISGLWPVDRNVFTDADFAPSMVTHATHVAKPAIPKENPENSGYIPVEKICPLPSNSVERARPKSRKKRSASGVVLTGTPHKNSLNGTNIAGSLGAKPKKKRLFATAKTVAHKKQTSTSAEKTCCLVCGETYDEDWIQCEKCKIWSHEDCAELTDEDYYFCDTCVQD
jgi:hypothetical protein